MDLIDGLAPAIAIQQKNSTRNPRSTVATATEIYDYMRLLWARCGVVHCIVCDGMVKRDTVDEIASKRFWRWARERGCMRCSRCSAVATAPAQPSAETAEAAKPGRKTRKAAAKVAKSLRAALSDALRERLGDLRKRGFNRLYQNGDDFRIFDAGVAAGVDFGLPVFVLVDRIAVSAENRARIVDAAEIGYRESGEILFEVLAARADAASPQNGSERVVAERLRFSGAFECKSCHRVYREPEPSLFQFNNPYGACPRCQGFGNTIDFDLNLIIPG